MIVHAFETLMENITNYSNNGIAGTFSFTSCHARLHVVSLHAINRFNEVFSHIRSLGAAGALAVDICICFHDIES